jgi:hypothetical protein
MSDAEQVPDIYADQFIMTTSIWGVAMSFLKSPPHPSPGQAPQAAPQAIIRMSLEHTKIIAMLLRQQLKNWERENVGIAIPHSVYNGLGLSEEDW